jgi:hypothetical protein
MACETYFAEGCATSGELLGHFSEGKRQFDDDIKGES